MPFTISKRDDYLYRIHDAINDDQFIVGEIEQMDDGPWLVTIYRVKSPPIKTVVEAFAYARGIEQTLRQYRLIKGEQGGDRPKTEPGRS